MKTRTLLVAAAMILSFTAAAYAQATFTVGSIPVTAVIRSGNAEKTGDITFTIVSVNTAINSGTITITYGVPITSPSGNVTVASNPAGLATLNSVSYSGGTVVMNVTAVAGAGVNSTIVLSGVRVAVAGTSLTALDANISAVGNAITAGQTSVRVINSIAAGLASIGYASGTSAGQINAVSGGVDKQSDTIRITENFLSAFGATVDATQTQPPLIRLTLNQLPPPYVTITFPGTANATSGTTAWQTCDGASPYTVSGANAAVTSDSTSLSVYYRLVTGSDPTATERMGFIPTVTVDTSKATLPLSTTSYSLTATFYPIAAAFNSDGSLGGLPIPRYVAEEVGPLTFLNVVGSSSAMLFPYMTASKVTGYDTGIAIANTTTDPGKSKLGITGGATKQAGTITFYFYPQVPAGGSAVPSAITYTTKAGTSGTGLDSTGSLPSGSTFTVLCSQLLKDAGITDDFTGYMIAVGNFSNGHAQYFVSNFTTFSQGGQALILTGDRKSTPEALNN